MAYRRLIEVLKWADPYTVLGAAAVSQLWRQVCASEELWDSLLASSSLTPDPSQSNLPLKEAYRLLNQQQKHPLCLLLEGQRLSVFDCYERRFTQTWQLDPFSCAPNCAAVLISYSEVVFCGGNTDAVVLFSLLTGKLKPAANMLNRRSYHSAVCINKVVYVFGNYYEETYRTGERFDMEQWRPLPDMLTGRAAFNACVQKQLIYLCGGYTTLCEVFDTNLCTYTPLQFELGNSDWTVSFFYKDELISIITNTAYYHKETGIEEKTCNMILIP